MKNLLRLMGLFLVASSTVLAQRADLSGLKFCIDPGHGGHNPANDRLVIPDPGIEFWESESNFQKALLLKPMLEAYGATVILTRYTNDYPYDPATGDPTEPSLTARYTIANENNVNWFHSIHSNATGGTNTSTNYTMVLLKEDIPTRKAAFPAAIDMSAYIYNNIRAKDRTQPSGGNISGKPGVYLDYTFYGGPGGGYNLGVLSGLLMPGELSEGSFHDYFPETRRLMNNSYRKMEAYGILDGFLQYYGVPSDTLCAIAGIQTNGDNGNPVNGTSVRIVPGNRTFVGDSMNNGYYLFDSLNSGNHTIVYETDGFSPDSVNVTLASGEVLFVDHILQTLLPPVVTSVSPANNLPNVNAISPIEISFTKTMDTASVRAAFSITPAVDGIITWKNNFRTFSFAPRTHFDHLTKYVAAVSGTAKSVTGFFLDGNNDGVAGDPFTLSFTTEAPVPPFVSVSRPLSNDTSYSVSGIIGLRFSKSMDTASVSSAFSVSPPVEGSLVFGSNNSTLTLTPKSKLPFNTWFTVRVEGTASSTDGVFLDGNRDSTAGDAFVLNFRTQFNPAFVAEKGDVLPSDFTLLQNYPNPFNPATTISFSVPGNDRVSLVIYDALGRTVSTLIDQQLGPGHYEAAFDGSHLPSGVYLCRLASGGDVGYIKIMLVK